MKACPKCAAEIPDSAETCPKCGLVLSKWKPPPAPKGWLGRYEYRMVSVPEAIVAKSETLTGGEAAEYLEAEVNKQAAEGWEFLRVDEMWLSVSSPGIFGTRAESKPFRHDVLTFRREKHP